MRKVLDSIDVTIADSFVDPSNKLASTKGNGEYRLYVGYWTSKFDVDFFGPRGFKLHARLLKSELLRFMHEIKSEYYFPTADYRKSDELPQLWVDRVSSISQLPNENIDFYVRDVGPEFNSKGEVEERIYIRSDDSAYNFLHSLPLSGTSSLKIVKILENNQTIYEFHLIPDLQGYSSIPRFSDIENEIKVIEKAINQKEPIRTTIERVVKSRIGQNKFRIEVIKACNGLCPFTKINDVSLMNAGHIKPWSVSNDEEKLDPQNGFLFTLTYDRLFNNGFMSFTDDRKLIVSSMVSKKNLKLLNLVEGSEIAIPLIKGKRKTYLDYHREIVFRK